MEEILVGLIVVGSALFSAWRLMSPRLRLRTLDFAAPMIGRLSPGMVARLRTRTIGQLAAGCSACSHNKTAVHHPGGRRG
ncbi:MAG: hypothetical protein ACREU6_08290 [Steroidobacteraceae bacterium]